MMPISMSSLPAGLGGMQSREDVEVVLIEVVSYPWKHALMMPTLI